MVSLENRLFCSFDNQSKNFIGLEEDKLRSFSVKISSYTEFNPLTMESLVIAITVIGSKE